VAVQLEERKEAREKGRRLCGSVNGKCSQCPPGMAMGLAGWHGPPSAAGRAVVEGVRAGR